MSVAIGSRGSIDANSAFAMKLSNGWIIRLLTNASSSEIWYSTNGGASWGLFLTIPKCYKPQVRGMQFMAVGLDNGTGSVPIYGIDLSNKVVGSNIGNDWQATTDILTNWQVTNTYWASNGYYYIFVSNFGGEGDDAWSEYRTYKVAWGGSIAGSVVDGFDSHTAVIESEGYIWNPGGLYGFTANIRRVNMDTLVFDTQPGFHVWYNGTGSSSRMHTIWYNPVDSRIYGMSSSGMSLSWFFWDGSGWTSLANTSITATGGTSDNRNTPLQPQVGKDGLIYLYFYDAGNGGFYYVTVNLMGLGANGTPVVSASTYIGQWDGNAGAMMPSAFGSGAGALSYAVPSIQWSAPATLQSYLIALNSAPNAPTITAPAAGSYLATRTPTVSWTFSDPDASDTQSAFYVELWNGMGNAVLAVSGWITGAATSYTIPLGWITVDDSYHLQVYTRDSSGAQSAGSGLKHFYSDITAPTIGGITGPTNTNQPTQRMSIIGVADNLTSISHVDAYILSADASTWSGPFIAANDGGGTWHYDFNVAYQGNAAHTVRFWVYDGALNGSARDSAIYYDTIPPTIASVQGYSYTNVKTGTRRVWAYGVTDSLSGVANVTATYLKPGGTRTAITAYQSGSDWYVDVPLDGATEGEWNVQFQAKDRAGNSSGIATAYFFVDTQRAGDPNPGAVWGQTQATLTWSGFADPSPSSGYDHTVITLGEWDGTSWVGGAPSIYNELSIPDSSVSQKVATGLIPGKRYRYTVAYYDKAGNQSAYTWHEFVTKRKIGEQRVKTSSGTASLPIYDPLSGVVGSTALRAKTASGSGCFELVATNDTNASPLRVKTTQGIMAVSKFGGT